MELNTHLPVPVFNVLKYLLITFATDGVVRSGLDSFEHFIRRLSIHRGNSVQLETNRLDRYNLLHQISFRHFASLLLLFITFVAYGIEIGLEFATNSRIVRFPIAGSVRRVNYTRGVCSLDAILYHENAIRFARLAEECIILENGIYRLYRPIWIIGPENEPQPLCEPVPENLLYESKGIYNSLEGEGEQAKREVGELLRTMRRHSYKSNDDAERAVIAMRITSKDVIGKLVHEDNVADPPISAAFMKRLSDTGVKCFGTVRGRAGEGMMRLAMLACTSGFNENGTMSYAEGTGFVEVDIEDVGDDWSTTIVVETRRSIYHFATNVVGRRLQNNAVAFAVFFAESRAQDNINVNKYAIAYRNCRQLSVPSRKPEAWVENVPIFSSELRTTATVELWAIIVLGCWIVVITLARILLHAVANHKGMPNKLLGEQHMVRLWLEEKEGEHQDLTGKSKRSYLSVEAGEFTDHITATNAPRDIIRDRRKRFSSW